MELEYHPSSLEREVEAALRDAHDASSTEWGPTRWTSEIKARVGAVGASMGLTPYSSTHGSDGTHSEWLFDLALLQMREGWIKHCALALESEWGQFQAVSDDFQKLILARSDHRLIVFEASSNQDAAEIVERLIDEVDAFEGSSPEDRYMFAAWITGHGFDFYTYSPKPNAASN